MNGVMGWWVGEKGVRGGGADGSMGRGDSCLCYEMFISLWTWLVVLT